MTHEDWFDSDGFFIGHIPRVIWRQVAEGMPYNDVLDCANALKFTVDRDMAIGYIWSCTAWNLEELKSWSQEELTVEILSRACGAIADFDTFQLLNNESIK